MNTHINRHIGREKHVMQNSIITVVFYLHDYKTSNVVESNWFLCWGSSGGGGDNKRVRGDWPEPARLVFRLRGDWSDLSTSRPRVVPWTCCMLKGCAQPVLSLEGLSLPGWQVRPQEQPRGRCCRSKKNTHFSSFHRRIRDSPWGWINLKPLFFSFSF